MDAIVQSQKKMSLSLKRKYSFCLKSWMSSKKHPIFQWCLSLKKTRHSVSEKKSWNSSTQAIRRLRVRDALSLCGMYLSRCLMMCLSLPTTTQKQRIKTQKRRKKLNTIDFLSLRKYNDKREEEEEEDLEEKWKSEIILRFVFDCYHQNTETSSTHHSSSTLVMRQKETWGAKKKRLRIPFWDWVTSLFWDWRTF